ncbi:MAG: mannose-1-phosphate guanylyltransferase [Opitutales bacterium]|nr:mannose-1-phosphate guanylyltransferase [Opitutales bacterium]
MSSRYVVIMAGGRGERFWPLSRLACPKHLLPVVGDQAMLVQTIERLGSDYPAGRILVITNVEQRDAVLRICPQLPEENVIAEPVGRDTAAAVALATVLVRRRDPDASFAMLPADHVIYDKPAFQKVLQAAFAAAEAETALVTVGIRPAYPATGYGYIQRGDSVAEREGQSVYDVHQFREKPDAATAEEYLQSGDFYWNAGMFFWTVTSIQKAFEELTPELWQSMEQMVSEWLPGNPIDALLERYYPGMEKISVDYAIMEKAPVVRVLEADFDWDDVGEWPAVARHYPKDANGNVVRGNAVALDSHKNIVRSEPGHVITLVGVDNLMVIQTADATLVCPRDKAQDIKALVKKLGDDPRYQHLV